MKKKRSTRFPRKKGPTILRKKYCRFCNDPSIQIDYKDFQTLYHFISERGKIVPRRISGNCAWHQRRIALAIKRARIMGLVPFVPSIF